MSWIKKFVQVLVGVVLLISLVIVLIRLFSSATGPRAASYTIDPHATPTPTPPSTYDPAYYGLPPTIAGYKTFAVLTADNTACVAPGEKRLVLQATQANVQDFLSASSYAAIQQDLQQRGFADFVQSNVQIVGPATTLDQFLSENEKWNQQRKSGCVSHLLALTGSDYQEYKAPGVNGYAMYDDTDASLYTTDNAQSERRRSRHRMNSRPANGSRLQADLEYQPPNSFGGDHAAHTTVRRHVEGGIADLDSVRSNPYAVALGIE